MKILETHDCVITKSVIFADGGMYYDFFQNTASPVMQFQANDHYQIIQCACGEDMIYLEFQDEPDHHKIDLNMTWEFVMDQTEAAVMRMML